MYRKSSIIQSFLDEFSASVLTLPVRFNDDTLIALWTPWAEPFSQFSRLRPVEEDMVYTPTPGQVRWKNGQSCSLIKLTDRGVKWLERICRRRE